eukprot:TRINITY_DN7008_c0_g1_i1.p1 TRINITY_DN7008_c0_g1~~TRINITY_DN7008_c0_g1_i1.p1  ORF type:complete len:389 (+),score=103.78 TRINITY_DN7008_c0_g1_i1:102-1268(+)
MESFEEYSVLPGESKFLDMASYVDTLRNTENFIDETYKMLRDPSKLLEILLSVADLIFQKASDKDIEGYFSVVAEAVLVAKDDAQKLVLANKFMDVIAANTQDRPSVRLAILTNFYNLVPYNSSLRFNVFLRIVQYAGQTGSMHLFKPQISEIDAWVASWNISTEQSRTLLKTFAEQLFAVDSLKADGFDLYVKYLQTFQDADAATLLNVKEDATQLLRHAISTPSIFQMENLLDLKAVQQLQKEKIYELFSIFVNESIDVYNKFASTNADWIASQGLNTQAMEDKMRLLSLATLSSEKSDFTFDTVAKSLQIDISKVETWVIRAIAAKLIEAQIDQQSQTIIISSTTQRVFTQKQWEQLRSRLVEWKASIQQVLGVIERTRSSSGGL